MIATGALAAAPPSPATASDATLKAEIESVLVELRPALTEFQEAADGLEQAKDTSRLQTAAQGLRAGLSRYKWGVINRKTSSTDGAKAKKVLLTGIREFDIGLVEYEKGLEKLDAGAKKASVLSSLRTANRRFIVAARRERKALDALGVMPPK